MNMIVDGLDSQNKGPQNLCDLDTYLICDSLVMKSGVIELAPPPLLGRLSTTSGMTDWASAL